MVLNAELSSDRVLVVGDTKRWDASGQTLLGLDGFAFCDLSGLTTDLIRDFSPQVVLSSLIGDDFDVVEVATILRRLGYKGIYRAVAPQLPRRAIVRAEVSRVAPDLDFDVLIVPVDKSNVA
jgi:hypothetical protein